MVIIFALRTDACNADDLKTTATELQDLVQSTVGSTKFANVYNGIRQKVLGVRRERRAARAIQVRRCLMTVIRALSSMCAPQTATNPEAAARRKIHRNGVKKESRKRKDETFM